jgi:hypothetical protein
MLKGEIDAALVAHIKWLVIFKNHLSGVERSELDPEMIGDGTACHFGQWLHANQGFLPLPEQFEYIQSLHASFHLAAAKLAVAVKGNTNPQELKRQMEVLQGFSNQLIAALSEVKVSLFPLRRSVAPMPEMRRE